MRRSSAMSKRRQAPSTMARQPPPAPLRDAIYLDFETKPIAPRPDYPPWPVGLAVLEEGHPPEYLAWGHPTGNNRNAGQVRTQLQHYIRSGRPVVCYNSKFEWEIITHHFQLSKPAWHLCHDPLFLAYLDDPHERDLRLKALGVKYLGEPPSERDALQDYIFQQFPEARKRKSEWAAWIHLCPADVVAPYAIGDVVRTRGLAHKLLPAVLAAGMAEPYARELKLVPVLMENEREGVQVDLPLLSDDVDKYSKQFQRTDDWLRKRLKAPQLEVDKDTQLCDALERARIVAPDDWLLTPTGQRSTSKESLKQAVKDPTIAAVLEYRATLATCMRTFLEPWLRTAELGGRGRIYFNWNSTKAAGEEAGGTRTGRLSSSPNAQNIPTDENIEKAEKAILALIAKAKRDEWLPLPHVRKYIMADSPQYVLCDRDFNQQELRVLAHYEDGAMRQAYLDNPKLDLHDYAMGLIKENTGLLLTRKTTKTIAFGLLYGMGDAKLAARLGVPLDEARAARRAYLSTFPGIEEISKDLKYRSRSNDYMTTWGGRRYYAEPPRVINGIRREFGYKLLNYLIQGSSADITKEAILRYSEARKESRLILTVHDEIMICAPQRYWRQEMDLLRTAMHSIELAVPLLSDGEYGPRWFEMSECE